MSRYRKKPVVIDAVQWTGDNPNEVKALTGTQAVIDWATTREDRTLVIPTLEGDHVARPGDWIIRGVKGELYPCQPDIFEATYEPVVPAGPAHPKVEEHP
jgi:hypothetical protein